MNRPFYHTGQWSRPGRPGLDREGTECPTCGDDWFTWWRFAKGIGVQCHGCHSKILVYKHLTDYSPADFEEDVRALAKAMNRMGKGSTGELP